MIFFITIIIIKFDNNNHLYQIQSIPTFITPKANGINGKSLVLDLGGTNYRVALVNFRESTPAIHPNNGWKKDMSIMKSPGYTREELFKELADMIIGIKREEEMPIGYCFSYPAESTPDGDTKLLRWTKGEEFEGKFDAQKLTAIMNYPDIYKDVYVQVAQWIYGRSAQLVAASLTGLIMLLKSYNKDIRKICLVAEGSLFWSEHRKGQDYNVIVTEKLRELFRLSGLEDIEVDIKSMNNANLIGTGIAALS